MTSQLSPLAIQKFFDNNGAPLAFGLLTTYQAGTTTLQATYVDSTQTTQNTNPINLNFRGECNLWLDPTKTYKFLLQDSQGNTIPGWPVDNIPGSAFVSATGSITIPVNLVPTPTNTETLGTPSFSWAQIYLGANSAPAYDPVSGNIGYYARTAAEISAGVTPTNYVYQPGDVRRYGADPTGAGDSTAAFRAAGSIGMLITVPKGTYKVSAAAGTINITGGGMKGDGAYQSTIASTDTSTNDTFTYTGALAGVFQDIQFSPSATKGAGAFQLTIGPASGEVSGMRILQCVFNNSANHLYFKRASLWSMMACNFYAFSGTAVLVDNQNDGDSGDSAILGCQFTSPGNSGSYAIRQVSSGGLKITTTKFNNVGVGYLLDLGTVVGHVSTSITLIDNCSFETATFSAIQLQRQVGSTATFANFSVVNCEFLVQGASASGIFSNDSSGFLSNVSIGPNVFSVTGTGGATGIQMDYVTNLSIGKQDMQGSGGTSTGILIGTHCTGVSVSKQQIRGFQFSINAPTSVAIEKGDIQTGSVNVTTSSADGSFFSGTATVTFPTPYDADITLTTTDAQAWLAGTGGGGLSCSVTAINSTTMTVQAIGFTNSGVVAVNWRVAGVY